MEKEQRPQTRQDSQQLCEGLVSVVASGTFPACHTFLVQSNFTFRIYFTLESNKNKLQTDAAAGHQPTTGARTRDRQTPRRLYDADQATSTRDSRVRRQTRSSHWRHKRDRRGRREAPRHWRRKGPYHRQVSSHW